MRKRDCAKAASGRTPFRTELVKSNNLAAFWFLKTFFTGCVIRECYMTKNFNDNQEFSSHCLRDFAYISINSTNYSCPKS